LLKNIFFLKDSIMPTDRNSGQGGQGRLHPTAMIVDYLDGILSPSDKIFFEEQMKNNPSLVKSVLLQKKIKYALDHPDLQDDIALLQQANENTEAESKMPVLLLVGLFLIAAVGMCVIFF